MLDRISKTGLKLRNKDYNIFIALIILFSLARVFLPAVPASSTTFDCDDSVMLMYHHFSDSGFSVTPIMGDIDAIGEQPSDCNHAWLIVNIFGQDVAYDWGLPRFDSQHYEGFAISLDELQQQIEMDYEKEY